jgi:hypothetical protein
MINQHSLLATRHATRRATKVKSSPSKLVKQACGSAATITKHVTKGNQACSKVMFKGTQADAAAIYARQTTSLNSSICAAALEPRYASAARGLSTYVQGDATCSKVKVGAGAWPTLPARRLATWPNLQASCQQSVAGYVCQCSLG